LKYARSELDEEAFDVEKIRIGISAGVMVAGMLLHTYKRLFSAKRPVEYQVNCEGEGGDQEVTRSMGSHFKERQ